jgi:hypothetical protein
MSTIESMDPDVFRSSTHRAMIEHLVGPFRGGAADTVVALDETNHARVGWNAREPLLLLALKRDLGTAGVSVRVTVTPDDSTTLPVTTICFDSFSESGAALPVYCPVADPTTQVVGPFAVDLSMADGTELPTSSTLSDWVELRIVEGVLGRLLYVLGAEKARLRRHARELVAIRRLEFARDDALDRLGADLGVPRFSEHLTYDPAQGPLVSAYPGASPREPDAEYRRRLALYRSFLLPNRRRILELLNGPGSGDNTGLLGQMGFTDRVELTESDTEFAVGIKLVGVVSSIQAGFFKHVREVHLLQPAFDAPATRFLPTTERERENALRARLRTGFHFPQNAVIVPGLAVALDRVGRCRKALGLSGQWTILRAQDDNGGSRFELGLAVEAALPNPADLQVMVDHLTDGTITPDTDPETRALLGGMNPLPPAKDPVGRWLLEPCGLKTIHVWGTQTLYLSHFPVFGMQVTAVSGTPLSLAASYKAESGSELNVVLDAVLRESAQDWINTGHPAWKQLTGAQGLAAWDSAVAPSAATAAAFQAAGFAVVPNLTAVNHAVAALKAIAPDLLATVRLDANSAAQILANAPEAGVTLRSLIENFRHCGAVSLLPLVTAASEVIVVVSVMKIPDAGLVLSTQVATGFRWYCVPIVGSTGELSKGVGSFNSLSGLQGLSAVIVVGYARKGHADPRGRIQPYEVLASLPSGTHLDLQQYEFLMNALDRAHAIGITINTTAIRQAHVDMDGDGSVDPLPPRFSRTFRPFQHRRHVGERGITLAE